ncbi:MAG: GntP family permease [Planctomycetota bacterium]|nr:MAG: GntP family permease [Planctomycetota bacterium]
MGRMNVLLVASLGIAIVLGLILGLRLHPLVALLVASLFLLAATPTQVYLDNALKDEQVVVERLSQGWVGLPTVVPDGEYAVWSRGDPAGTMPRIGLERLPLQRLATAGPMRGVSGNLVWYSARLPDGGQLAQEDVLVPVAALERAQAARWTSLGSRLTEGFGRTARKLGIPVTMAAIIGVCLLESGAATRIVTFIMALFGSRGTGPALTLSGFLLGIPVFFDNVFYLLLPLAKAAGRLQPRQYVTAVMAIVVGATMAHSLVPPTPGPLFVASAIGVELGIMMIGGLVVGGFAAGVGLLYGMWCSRWLQIRPPDSTFDPAPLTQRRIPLLVAPLPIAVPILLLSGSSILELVLAHTDQGQRFSALVLLAQVVGDPALVFLASALLALGLLRIYGYSANVGAAVARGLSDAGMIVLLTSAGGAFGYALQQLQLATAIANNFQAMATPWGLLLTAFLLTTLIRGAQGSATVAMMTSAAIVGPVVATTQLPFHPLYVALAIGCGSKPLSWMNDSGFWQVCTMSGMTTAQTLRSFTVALTLMGTVGFAITLLGAWLLPMVEPI